MPLRDQVGHRPDLQAQPDQSAAVQSLSAEVAALSQRLAESQGQVTAAQSQIATLDGLLQTSMLVGTRAQEQSEKDQANVAALKQLLDMTAHRALNEISSLKAQVDEFKSKERAALQQLEDAKFELIAAGRTRDQELKKAADLESALRAELKQAESQSQAAMSKVRRELVAESLAREGERVQAESKAEARRKENAACAQRLGESRKLVADLRRQLAEGKSAAAAEREAAARALAAAEETVEQIRAQHAVTKRQLDALTGAGLSCTCLVAALPLFAVARTTH